MANHFRVFHHVGFFCSWWRGRNTDWQFARWAASISPEKVLWGRFPEAWVEGNSKLSTILIVMLMLMLLGTVGTLPSWGYSRSWGYGPSGGLGLVVLILVVLLLLGRL